MGTRSLTLIKEDGTDLVCFYKQYDGYPDGYGKELVEFLKSGTLVNGIPYGEDKLFFNGMGCLAAQIVAHFKENSGGYYIFPIDSKGCGQEYIYTVYNKDMKLFIKVEDYKGKILFDGSINEFSVELCKENKNYADKPKPTKQD